MFRKILILSATMSAFIFRMHATTVPRAIESFLGDTTNDVDDEGLLPDKPKVVLEFCRFVVGNSREVQANFLILAPDARRQRLVLAAAEFLPPRDYVSFVSGICDLAKQGKVTLDAIKAIASAHAFKDGFLAFNYDKPAVVAVISKLDGILKGAEPGKWEAFFMDLESGNAKNEVVAERKKDGNPMPESYEAGATDEYKKLMGIQ